MTAEGLAAVVGLSAGAGSMVGWWAHGWWRDRVPFGQRQLLRYAYAYFDERIGATRTENIRRAARRHTVINKRRWYWWLVPKPVRRSIADYFWPVPQLGTGTSPLPSTKRMARYVQLEFGVEPSPWRRWMPRWLTAGLLRLWNVQAIVVWPTSEVDVHTAGFETVLARWAAWALRLPGPGHVQVEANPEAGYWRLARRGPTPEFAPTVPHGVAADA